MTNRESIFRSIRYIEDNLGEDIRVSDVARESGYSLFHFIRLFSAITGFTPKDYILRRKLTEAAKRIESTDRRIIDIAFEFEFQTHESFTRAFRRCFGENPADFRKSPRAAKSRFLEPSTDRSGETTDAECFRCDLVTLDTIHLVGLTVFVEIDTRLIGRMWHALVKNAHTVANRKIPEVFHQLSYWTEDPNQNGFYCMAGIETSDLSEIPSSMCGKTVGGTEYLRFIHRGLAKDVGRTYEYIYGTVLPATEYRLPLPYNIERYGEKCLGPNNPDSESEIFIPICPPPDAGL
jgi:AraC family transcriptional regulator